jgi:CRP/FNR family transcriptional regulator
MLLVGNCTLNNDLLSFEDIISKQYLIKKNQLIYRECEPFKSIYFIKSGSIKTYQVDHLGKKHKMRFHFTSDLIGLCGIYDNQFKYNAMVLETTLICEIQFDDLINLSIQSSDFLNQLIITMSIGFTPSYQFCLNSSAQQRFSSFLLQLASKTKYSAFSSSHVRLSMTKKDIGIHLGLSLETICRLFAKFQKANLITCTPKTIMLLDLDRIKKIAIGIQDIDNCIIH